MKTIAVEAPPERGDVFITRYGLLAIITATAGDGLLADPEPWQVMILHRDGTVRTPATWYGRERLKGAYRFAAETRLDPYKDHCDDLINRIGWLDRDQDVAGLFNGDRRLDPDIYTHLVARPGEPMAFKYTPVSVSDPLGRTTVPKSVALAHSPELELELELAAGSVTVTRVEPKQLPALAIGQRWKTRDNKTVTVVENINYSPDPWVVEYAGGQQYRVWPNGRYLGNDTHANDLFELLLAPVGKLPIALGQYWRTRNGTIVKIAAQGSKEQKSWQIEVVAQNTDPRAYRYPIGERHWVDTNGAYNAPRTDEIDLETQITAFPNMTESQPVPQTQPHPQAQQMDPAQLIAAVIAAMAAAGFAPSQQKQVPREVVAEVVREELLKQAPQTVQIIDPKGTTRMVKDPHPLFETLITLINADIPVWVPGPAGSGKTHAAQMAAEALGLDFHPLSVCAQTGLHHIMGFTDANGTFHETPFTLAYKNGGLFLLDEADRGNPNVLLSLNSALANGFCTMGDGAQIKRHDKFRCVAGANTFGSGPTAEYVGACKIDAATLNRFAFLPWDYDEDLERKLTNSHRMCHMLQDARKKAAVRQIRTVISTRSILHAVKIHSVISDERRVCKLVLGGLNDEQFTALVG